MPRPDEFREIISAELKADPEFRDRVAKLETPPTKEASITEVVAIGAGVLAVGLLADYHEEALQFLSSVKHSVSDAWSQWVYKLRNPLQ